MTKIIATHDGTFHADEVLACMLLTEFTQAFKNAKIIRSRDLDFLEKADCVVDVGSIYDASRHRYDHHQVDFSGKYTPNCITKFSSAGLIYKHFGKEIVENLLINTYEKHDEFKKAIGVISDDDIAYTYNKLYWNFILYIDCIDNGVNQFTTGTTTNFKINSDFVARISRLRPVFYENTNLDEMFATALKYAKDEFVYQFRNVAELLVSKKVVQKAFNARYETHKSGKIIKIDTPIYSWLSPLLETEQNADKKGIIEFVVFEDVNGGSGWRVKAVSNEGFRNRAYLRDEWAGQKKVPEIPDFIFVHKNKFIGGAKSYESTLKMAELSLNNKPNSLGLFG